MNPGQNLTMIAGENATIHVITRRRTGAVVDLTSGTLTWVVKRAGSTTVVLSKALGSGLTLVGAATLGTFDVEITTSNSASLSGGYVHECRLTEGSGAVSTIFTGTLLVIPSIV